MVKNFQYKSLKIGTFHAIQFLEYARKGHIEKNIHQMEKVQITYWLKPSAINTPEKSTRHATGICIIILKLSTLPLSCTVCPVVEFSTEPSNPENWNHQSIKNILLLEKYFRSCKKLTIKIPNASLELKINPHFPAQFIYKNISQ